MIFTKHKQYKYVRIITKQSDTKSNPKPKPNYYLIACNSKHSTKHSRMSYVCGENLYETMFSHSFFCFFPLSLSLCTSQMIAQTLLSAFVEFCVTFTRYSAGIVCVNIVLYVLI